MLWWPVIQQASAAVRNTHLHTAQLLVLAAPVVPSDTTAPLHTAPLYLKPIRGEEAASGVGSEGVHSQLLHQGFYVGILQATTRVHHSTQRQQFMGCCWFTSKAAIAINRLYGVTSEVALW